MMHVSTPVASLICIKPSSLTHTHTPHYGKQWVCRVPKHTAKTQKHSAKDLPCVTHGKQRTAKLGRHTGCLPCARKPFFGHTAKPLPCVLSGPRQNKVTPSTQHATWAVYRVPHGQAHDKQCHLCRVPRGQAHGKEWQLCRVTCHGTWQKMVAHGKINFQIPFFV